MPLGSIALLRSIFKPLMGGQSSPWSPFNRSRNVARLPNIWLFGSLQLLYTAMAAHTARAHACLSRRACIYMSSHLLQLTAATCSNRHQTCYSNTTMFTAGSAAVAVDRSYPLHSISHPRAVTGRHCGGSRIAMGTMWSIEASSASRSSGNAPKRRPLQRA